jgi:carboxyl-terminal processing protease
LIKYEKNPAFEVQIIENQYGYILMPAMLMIDLPQDSINLETQRMYDEIMKLNSSYEIKGWIIDLRFNSGGNVFPMLAALYHFLGDHTLYNCLDLDSEIKSQVFLKNGVIHDTEDSTNRSTINPSSPPNEIVPIAMITGILTASAGELIAISFRGRSNIITIGEPTAGFTSANSLTPLPFDTKVTLTTSLMYDRNYQHSTIITPDISIVKEANFENLTQDANVIAAIRFFESFE